MKRFSLISKFGLMAYILFSSLFFIHTSLNAEELEINSEVYSISSESDCFIIKAGSEQGIEIGDGLIVHREGKKIAEAIIIEVHPVVSAAEILNLVSGQELEVGDNIILVKRIEENPKEDEIAQTEQAEEEPVTRKSKWTTILGTASGRPRQSYQASEANEAEETIFSVDVKSPVNVIFPYTLEILREKGYSVTYTNRLTGAILAAKPIELPIISELWADSIAAIDHKLVLSLHIKENNNISELNLKSFKEHFQKGKHIKTPIGIDSKYYLEIEQITSMIKERAESY